MASFEGVLAGIPGYGGYLAKETYNRNQTLGDIQQMSGIQGMLAKMQAQQRAQQVQGVLSDASISPEQKRMALVGLMQDPSQAANAMHQMETEKANAALRVSQTDTQRRLLEEAQRKSAQDARMNAASEQLQGILSPRKSEIDPDGAMVHTAFSEDEAKRMLQSGTAQRVRIANPNEVRSLGALLAPKETLAGILSPQKTQTGLMNVGQGAKVFDPVSRQMVFENPAAPRAQPEARPYSDIGKVNADLKAGIITPDEAATVLKSMQAKKDITIDRGTVANAFKFRQEYTANPEVKRANMLESTIGPVAQYIASVDKTGMNPTADLALVKAFLSMTHPKGDQISNMDRVEIGKLGNFGDRFGNSIESFASGKNLPDQVRKDMWREVSGRFKVVSDQRNKLRADILKRAESARVPADLIFGEQ